MRDLGHGEGSTWGCKSVQEFLRSEWTFFLVEEQPSAFSEHLRPVRHILSDEYFHVAQYIALTQMNVDAKDAAVIADFFNHLDEQLWELTGGGGGGLSEDSEEMALHADSGAIGAIATTLERFCFEPFVLQNALRCLADLCLGHAPQLPPMTRAGRAKYAVNSARLAARRGRRRRRSGRRWRPRRARRPGLARRAACAASRCSSSCTGWRPTTCTRRP